MKKIIALLAVSALIVSCTNNEIETVENNDENTGIVEQTTTNENIPEANEETNTGSEIEENQITEEEFEEKSNTGTIEENKETNIESITTEEISVEDEKILESEVNDLLDEFINSLDNYDK